MLDIDAELEKIEQADADLFDSTTDNQSREKKFSTFSMFSTCTEKEAKTGQKQQQVIEAKNDQELTKKEKFSTFSMFSTTTAKKTKMRGETPKESIAYIHKLNDNNNIYSNNNRNRLIINQKRQGLSTENDLREGAGAKHAKGAKNQNKFSQESAKISTSDAKLEHTKRFNKGRIKCIDCDYYQRKICDLPTVKFPYRAHWCNSYC